MPVKKEVYFVNTSDVSQELRHYMLATVPVVPAAPGGFITVERARIIVEPGQIVRVPIQIWINGQNASKRPWTKEVTKEDFMGALESSVAENQQAATIDQLLAELETTKGELDQAKLTLEERTDQLDKAHRRIDTLEKQRKKANEK